MNHLSLARSKGKLISEILGTIIILMSSQEQIFHRSFYNDQTQTIPSDFIFDQVYKSVSYKNKYSTNPKYSYYNALLDMKHKMSQNQSPVYQNIFRAKQKPIEKMQAVQRHNQRQMVPIPIYHVEKINKMKFKVYKQGVGRQYVQKLPIADLSFQIKLKGEQQLSPSAKPRLEEILNQYRKMNTSGRNSRSKTHDKKLSAPSDLNVKLLNQSMTRFARASSINRK